MKYILYLGSMNPKTKVPATDKKLDELKTLGFKQGTDYDVVSLKVLEEKLGGNRNMGGKLENPEKADLNKDGKLSKYEKTRGKAIEKNIKKDKINKRYGGKVRTPSNFGL